MPIDEEEWENAETAYSHLESVHQVLLDNPDKAYTVDEILEETNGGSSSGLVAMVELNVLTKLGEVEQRIVTDGENGEQVYYRAINQ